MVQEPFDRRNVEDLDPEQLWAILEYCQDRLGGDGQALQVQREDVNKVVALKVREDEKAKLQSFAQYLYMHPRRYIQEPTLAALIVYTINFTFTLHKQEAELEVKGVRRNV